MTPEAVRWWGGMAGGEAAAGGQTHPHGKGTRNTALKGPGKRACAALEPNLRVPSSHLHCDKAADTKE